MTHPDAPIEQPAGGAAGDEQSTGGAPVAGAAGPQGAPTEAGVPTGEDAAPGPTDDATDGAPADAPLDAPADDLAAAGPDAAPAGPHDNGPDATGADATGADATDATDAPVDPIVTLTRERDDYRDALIRLQADFENYKKRMIKQQTDHLERAAQTLVDKLLPVLDTADLALAHGGGEDVKQLTATLSGVLEREGLERIDPVGAPFDPTLHDAVAHEPGEADQQEVAEVLRAGYRWKGRVLRPAMVKVKG